MTKINFKKQKNTTLIASMILGLMMLSTTTIVPLAQGQQADKTNAIQQGTIINKDLGITDLDIESQLPGPMSDNDKNANENIVLNNDQIKHMLKGKTYKFMGVDYVGNVFDKNVKWKPELHINVENKTQIVVTVDSQTNQIADMKNFTIHEKASVPGYSPHGFASYYFSTANTVDGVSMVVPYVNHSTPGTSTTEVFLLNAISSGHTGDVCSSSAYPGSYFAQVGLEFDGNGVRKAFPMWTDTLQSCLNQYSTAPYTANHSWFFKIYTSVGYWVMYGVDQQDGTAIVSASTTGQSVTTFNTGDPNTSIFFENSNKGTSWSSEFVTNPSAQTIQYHNRSTNSWSSWSSTSTYDQKTTSVWPGTCNNIVSGADTSIMSVNSGTVTWNMSNMASQYPAC